MAYINRGIGFGDIGTAPGYFQPVFVHIPMYGTRGPQLTLPAVLKAKGMGKKNSPGKLTVRGLGILPTFGNKNAGRVGTPPVGRGPGVKRGVF